MGDTLRPDQRLISNNNDQIISNNGQFKLVMPFSGE
jgi:hypothetical protein